jgi:hypothetical protein
MEAPWPAHHSHIFVMPQIWLLQILQTIYEDKTQDTIFDLEMMYQHMPRVHMQQS